MWRASFITAMVIIAIVLGLGGAALRQDVPLLTGLCMIVGWLGTLAEVYDPLEAGSRHIEYEPLRLPCPLLALRAPGDEASLAIALAQVVQRLGYAGVRFAGLLARLWSRAVDAVDEAEEKARWWNKPLFWLAWSALFIPIFFRRY
jgi:hypothetical protein